VWTGRTVACRFTKMETTVAVEDVVVDGGAMVVTDVDVAEAATIMELLPMPILMRTPTATSKLSKRS
jgi:hypothetical protein